MGNNIYQSVYDEIINYVPEVYDEIIVYISYAEGSYEIKYFVKVDAQYIDCFDLQFSDEELFRLFSRIDKTIMTERSRLSKNELWSIMTMIINSSGQFNVYYKYDDISDNRIEAYENWKDEFLNK